MDKTQIKKLGTALVSFTIFIAMLCMIEYLPKIELLGSLWIFFIPAFIVAIPLLLTYVYVFCGYYYGAAVSIIGFGVAALVGVSVSVYTAVLFLPVVLTVSYTIINQKRFRNSILLCGAAALVGVAAVFGIIMLKSGMPIVDTFAEYFGKQLSVLSDAEINLVYTTARSADLLSGAVTQEAINATASADAIIKLKDIVGEVLNISIVNLMVVYSLSAGYLTYIIPRAVAKKMGRFVAPIPKFMDYELPKRFWLAAILLTIAAYIGENYGVRGFDILLYTLYNVFTFVFMVQGFCLLLYVFDQQKTKKGLKAVLIILAVLFLRTVALPIMGLLENMLGLRQRIKKAKEQTQ